MLKLTSRAVMGGVSVALLFASLAVFAQSGGGDGQGGAGGGNAHGAATPGPTYRGDPVQVSQSPIMGKKENAPGMGAIVTPATDAQITQ